MAAPAHNKLSSKRRASGWCQTRRAHTWNSKAAKEYEQHHVDVNAARTTGQRTRLGHEAQPAPPQGQQTRQPQDEQAWRAWAGE